MIKLFEGAWGVTKDYKVIGPFIRTHTGDLFRIGHDRKYCENNQELHTPIGWWTPEGSYYWLLPENQNK